MNKLEAQIMIEDTGNYDEDDEETILEIYDELIKNKGFEDRRRDKRFVVKFHDIFYYAPEEIENTDKFDSLFEFFCEDMYNVVCMTIEEDTPKDTINIDLDDMLTKQCVGHYQAFVVDIPEITDDNAVELAMNIYDEFPYYGKEYVKKYIKAVNTLQDLEDNYMEYWLEHLKANEYDEEYIKQIEEKYKADQERRKK